MGLQKELLGVWADALSIVRTAGVVYDQPWRRSLEQIVIRIRLMRHYATYGPFGIVTFGMLYNPLVVSILVVGEPIRHVTLNLSLTTPCPMSVNLEV